MADTAPIPALDQLPGLKAGWKDPNFYVTLAAYAAGCVLIARGQELIGGILMSVATGGSHLAAGLAQFGVHASHVDAASATTVAKINNGPVS